MATVGGGEGLVARLGRLTTRVAPSTIASSADHPVILSGGRAGGLRAVFTVSGGDSQVGLEEVGEGGRGAPRQAW